jgi:hypothetical protein
MRMRAKLARLLPSVVSVEGNILECVDLVWVYVSGVASQATTS